MGIELGGDDVLPHKRHRPQKLVRVAIFSHCIRRQKVEHGKSYIHSKSAIQSIAHGLARTAAVITNFDQLIGVL